MKQNTKKILFLIVPFCAFIFFFYSESTKGETAKEKGEIVIFKFDHKENLNVWKKSDNVLLDIQSSHWPAIQGSYAVVTFKKGNSPKMEVQDDYELNKNDLENPQTLSSNITPKMEASIELLKQTKETLSDYDHLEFRTYNPRNTIVEYTFNVKDPTSKKRSIPYYITLQPNEDRLISIDLKASPLYPKVDLINRYLSSSDKEANTIEFIIPLLPHDVEFYISSIKLRKSGTKDQKEDKIVFESKNNEDYFRIFPKTTMEQVFLEKDKFTKGVHDGNKYKLYAAKNESESFQAVIVPLKGDLANVSWTLSDLKDKDGNSIPTSVNMVGFVETTIQPRYAVPFLGWYPDPILERVSSSNYISENELLPLLVKVDVPLKAVTGLYKGELIVKSDKGLQKLPIELEVWNFELPKTSNFKFINQFYPLSSMSQFMPDKQPSNTYDERSSDLTRRYEDWMLKYRIQPGNIYSSSPPDWDVPRLKDLVNKGLNSVNLSYVRIDRKDAESYSEREHWKKVESQIKSIKKYIPLLKESGVWDDDNVLKYIFLFDEWPSQKKDIVYETAQRLKNEFPNVKIITTMNDITYGLNRKDGNVIDIWVPHVDILQSNKMYIDYAKTKNRQFGWYFAIGSYAPYPNFWIENPVIQSRIAMGALSYKYNTPLFVYWAVNRWYNNNPRFLDKGPKTRWRPASYGTKANNLAHGEGSLFYSVMSRDELGTKPVSTLRLENIRDGLEDYEYYYLLKSLYIKKGVGKTLNVDSNIIKNVADFTDDPTVLMKERKDMAMEILKLLH